MPARRLPAKLIRPRLYGATDRVRLFNMLDAWRSHALIWVAAPPGAGKTTLITTYLSQARAPALWYRLEPDDADPATFFNFLTQAAGALSHRRHLKLPSLTAEFLLDLPGFTRQYFRLLYRMLPPGTMLVFDAYEAVSSSPIDGVLAGAVLEAPPGMQLVVTSRETPPATLMPLESTGQIRVLSWESLRLTQDEARAIARTHRAAMSCDVANLWRYADGWVAGFVVVLDHVRRGGGQAIEIPGSVREALFGYFVSEMFAQADPRLRELLLRTALMPGFTIEQAQRLCPRSDAAAMLERLYRRHYFLDRGTGTDPVYRYHALFREFLLTQARERIPVAERLALLHQSGVLLEGRGQHEEALDLYAQAQSWPDAVRLICALAPSMLSQGRHVVLERLIRRVPQSLRDGSAWMNFWLGSARTLVDPPGARELLERAYDQFHDADDHAGALLACAAVCELYYLSWADLHPYRAWAHKLDHHLQMHGQLSTPEMEVRVLCALSLYLFVCVDGDRERFERWNARTIQLVLALEDPNARVAVASTMSFSLIAQGEWQTLRRIVEVTGEWTAEASSPTYWWILWQIMLCYMKHQQGDFQGSEAALRRGATIADQFGIRVVDLQIEGNAAMAALNARALNQARAHVERMGALLDTRRVLDAAHYEQLLSLLLVANGESELGLKYAHAAVERAESCGSPFLVFLCRIGRASALIDLGNFKESLEEADAILQYGRATGFRALEHAGLLLGAGAHDGLQDADKARGHLRRALRLGRECGIGIMFPTAPERFLQKMFDLALSENIERDYVCSLIGNLSVPAPAYAGEHWPWPVRIRTLGRLEILVHGIGVEHRRKLPKRPLTLLRWLLSRRGEARVERAIDALWPDEEADAAANALDSALHRLRRLLGAAHTIELHDGRLRLNPRLVWVDAYAFEGRAEVAESGDAAASDAALGLYRGHFLSEELDEPWCLSMRERLRMRYVRTAVARGRMLITDGAHDAALRQYMHSISIDPIVEDFYQGAMQCQLALKAKADGLALFDQLRSTLESRLRLQPTAESERLHRALQAL